MYKNYKMSSEKLTKGSYVDILTQLYGSGLNSLLKIESYLMLKRKISR